MTMMRSTLMPISRAVSGSCETACMPRPGLVRLTKYHSSAEQTASATRVKIAARWIVTPAMCRAGPVTPSICGNGQLALGVGEAPEGSASPPRTASEKQTVLKQLRLTASWRKTETPMAVMSGASRGALRSGR